MKKEVSAIIVAAVVAATLVGTIGTHEGFEPSRGAGDPQRAVRRQHRHLRLGVGRHRTTSCT